VVEEGSGEMLTDSRAQLGAGGEHGVRVDLVADLTRDVRLARKCQRKSDKSGFERAVG
jgi:hypothetical protein